MNYIKNDIWLFFQTKIFKNMAPLTIKEEIKQSILESEKINCSSIKYPYKPFLLLSIINTFKSDYKQIFTSEINLYNETIIKSFYNLITTDVFLFDILKAHSGKQNWDIGFNEKTKCSVFSIMLQGPIKKLESKWFVYDKTTKRLKFNFDVDPTKENFELLEQLCCDAIKKAIPWYQNVSNANIINLQEYYWLELKTNIINLNDINYRRRYQHIFRKIVLDRDKKCIICCVDNNCVLQACHIKPYSISIDAEKYDDSNGITLCSNHHKLFDNGFFSFDKNWNLIISNKMNKIDDNLFFRQYEPCYKMMLKNYPSMNNYIKYHYERIFQK